MSAALMEREKKRCPRCGVVKARDEFHRNAAAADGLASTCRQCCRGRVRGYVAGRAPVAERLADKLERRPIRVPNRLGCLDWMGARRGSTNGPGHGTIRVDDGRVRNAHAVAWELANGGPPPPDKPFILHGCDNPPCCEPTHLRPGTNADNMADMAWRGRSTYGERHPRAKLTADQVREIRRRYVHRCRGEGGNSAALAAEYGISQNHLRNIARGESWERAV